MRVSPTVEGENGDQRDSGSPDIFIGRGLGMGKGVAGLGDRHRAAHEVKRSQGQPGKPRVT